MISHVSQQFLSRLAKLPLDVQRQAERFHLCSELKLQLSLNRQ